MDFTSLKIPEGEVTKIRDSDGNLLWREKTLYYKALSLTCRDYLDNCTTGYLKNNGAISSGTWKVSDYLVCEPGTLEVSSPGAAPSVCFYTEDKVFISGENYNSTNPKQIVIPNNAYYLRWSMIDSNSTSYIQVPFSNYTELLKNTLIDKVINTSGTPVETYTSGSNSYYGECNGVGIPCEGKTSVNFSGFGTSAPRLIACFYNFNDVPIASSRVKPSVTEGSLSVPSDAISVRFSYYNTVNAKIPNAFKNFSIDVV